MKRAAFIMANAIWTVQLTDVQSFSAFLFLFAFLSIGIGVWLAFSGAGTRKPRSLVGTHTQRHSPAQRRRNRHALLYALVRLQ